MHGLQDALGPKGVITDRAEMARYLDDPLGHKSAPPRVVLRPASTAEVQQAMRWCQAQHLSVVPQGGLSGWSVPRFRAATATPRSSLLGG